MSRSGRHNATSGLDILRVSYYNNKYEYLLPCVQSTWYTTHKHTSNNMCHSSPGSTKLVKFRRKTTWAFHVQTRREDGVVQKNLNALQSA